MYSFAIHPIPIHVRAPLFAQPFFIETPSLFPYPLHSIPPQWPERRKKTHLAPQIPQFTFRPVERRGEEITESHIQQPLM